jgi:malonyl-CoA O-methyltransferase
MLRTGRHAPCCRLAGDLEHLPLAAASIDLYWSSLAVQWCDLPRALAEARRVIADGGALALASLGPATFHELRSAFAGVDAHRHTLSFHAPEELRNLAMAAGFVAVDVQNHTEIAYYPDFKSLLRAVKALGANQLGAGRRTSLLSRNAFARAELAGEALRTPAGLPLTYDVITLHART